MRVRIIASKPRHNDEGDITELIGEEFDVIRTEEEGIEVKTHTSPLGYFLYSDEYEVIEQKEGGLKVRYLVIKDRDIDMALNDIEKGYLERICHTINDCRNRQGKKQNTYLVLNVDESYASEVYALMFKHSHTPCNDCVYNPQSCGQETCQWLPVLISAYDSIFKQKETPSA